ncbi:MAG: RHS repeat-associated core domain-containing protein [Anaerolineae bacterium]|nr:RHS repeat-associated core domain-containing protein [Anaerolineae bacterium]
MVGIHHHSPQQPHTAGTSAADYGYTGQRNGASFDMLFLRARWYDVQTGRFVSQDPWSGSIQQPDTLHKYAYVMNSPANSVDPTGLFSPQQIEYSLMKDGETVEETFAGYGKHARWGLYALLLDANPGDLILPRYLDFKYDENSQYWPLAPAPMGAWQVSYSMCELWFFNPRVANQYLPLAEFVDQVEIEADERIRSWPSWRTRTKKLHWYERNDGIFYNDFKYTTEVPDVLVRSAGSDIVTQIISDPPVDFGLSWSYSKIHDRYGNEYWSASIDVGLGAGISYDYWEGYSYRAGSAFPDEILDEASLQKLILNTAFSISVQLGRGYSVDMGPSGSLFLHGLGPATGISYSPFLNWTGLTGNKVKPWDWVDRISGYDASIRNKISP